LGQPLLLTIKLHGETADSRLPAFSSKLQFPEGNDIDLYVQGPGEAEYRVSGVGEQGVYSANATEVAPGADIIQEIKVLADRSQPAGYIFAKPGEYTVRAQVGFTVSVAPDPKRIALPTTKITVKAPEGPAAEAWKLINDPAAARALQSNIITDDSVKTKFKTVADKYENTYYGKACMRAYALALTYARGAELRPALELLKRYEKRYRGEADTDLIVYTIVGSYSVLREYEIAREWFFEMLDQYPKSSLLKPQDRLFKFYYAEPAEASIKEPWYLLEAPWLNLTSKGPGGNTE
jgi:hypothetical protein